MTVAAVEALELSQLLGSLLASVVEAQAASARATVDFVESVGFEPGTDGERMRTVRLRYRKKDENSIPADFEVEVPLLALVNVPSLAVKQARLTFSYQVVRATAVEAQPAPAALPLATRLAPATLTGFLRPPPSPTPAPSRSTTSVDLDVTLEQQELPIGVERLFDLAELGMLEGELKRYVGNTNTLEVHDRADENPNCQLPEIKPEHRRVYATLEQAKADRPHDNCHWCLGSSTR